MSGRQERHFPSFGGGQPFEDRDSMDSMRERMDRDRAAFFTEREPQGRPFSSPFFRNAPTFDSNFVAPTDSLTSAFRSPRFGMGNFPGETAAPNNMDNNSSRPNYQQRDNSSGATNAHPENGDKNRSTSFNNTDSIPIRVVHAKPKNRYTSDGRNTTELSGVGESHVQPPINNAYVGDGGGGSPRLERAHSEPPKTFNQKLRAAGANPGAGGWVIPGTIPENAECVGGQAPRMNPNYHPHYNSASAPQNNLSTSASAPSVPSHQQNRPATAPPVAPPRRSVPSRANMNNSEQHHGEEPPAVRHIPIFVEGRDEPVFNKRVSNTEPPQKKASDSPLSGSFDTDNDNSFMRKPADFYPSGIKRVSRGATNPTHLDVHQQHPVQEPTSPISPPPGPIPMGYDPQVTAVVEEHHKEPTTPQPPPPGVPIPMPCSPNFMQQQQPIIEEEPYQQNSGPLLHIPPKDVQDAAPSSNKNMPQETSSGNVSRKTSAEESVGKAGVYVVPIKVEDEGDAVQSTKESSCENTENKKPKDPAIEKLEKIKDAVAELVKKIESFKGCKNDKEYLYLDEMLTRHMITLDSIEAAGRDDIRQLRKDAIRSINRCLSTLDARATVKMSASSENKEAAENNAIIDSLAAQSGAEIKN